MKEKRTIGEKKSQQETIFNKTSVLTTLLCLAPILLGVLFYTRLPDSVPSSFDFNGNAQRYMSKQTMVFLMPLFMAGMNGFCHFMLEADPKRKNYPAAMKLCSKWLIPVLTWIFIPVSLFSALGIRVPVTKIVMILLAFLFIIMGNYLPKCKQNYTVGIKTPWTLNSEENWNRTHHMAGYLWMLGGVCMLAGTFLVQSLAMKIAIPALLALIPSVYSYMLYRKGI